MTSPATLSEDTDADTLAHAAGLPNCGPYPYTSINLSRTAKELHDLAHMNHHRQLDHAATACRLLAIRRLQEAKTIPQSPSDIYDRRIADIRAELA